MGTTKDIIGDIRIGFEKSHAKAEAALKDMMIITPASMKIESAALLKASEALLTTTTEEEVIDIMDELFTVLGY